MYFLWQLLLLSELMREEYLVCRKLRNVGIVRPECSCRSGQDGQVLEEKGESQRSTCMRCARLDLIVQPIVRCEPYATCVYLSSWPIGWLEGV